MPWTSKILRHFRMIPHNPSAADFHGPYNKLLCTLFPVDTDFTVFPRYEPFDPESSAAKELFLFDVLYDDKLVFILEHKTPQDIKYGSLRDNTDLILRNRVVDMRPHCPLPVLHAVSAFGTRLCFYKMNHEDLSVHPPLIYEPESVSLRVAGKAPQESWDCDILKEEGEKRFKSMVEEIKQACAAL